MLEVHSTLMIEHDVVTKDTTSSVIMHSVKNDHEVSLNFRDFLI